VQEHWLWRERRRFSKAEAWIDLLLLANHKKTKVMVGQTLVTIERGWILTSQIGLAKRWGWNRKGVVSFLSVLKSDEILDIQTTVRGDNGYTILSVCNYSRYQDTENSALDNQTDGQPDKLGTFSGHSRDISKKDKNEKKKDMSGKPDLFLSSNNGISPQFPPTNRKKTKPARSNPDPRVEKVVRRLNELSGKSYGPESKDVTKYLQARLKDGSSEEDCLLVVEDRWQRWGSNPEMVEHFNPVTLFRPTKFGVYLTEARAANGTGPKGIADQEAWRKRTFING